MEPNYLWEEDKCMKITHRLWRTLEKWDKVASMEIGCKAEMGWVVCIC